MEIQLKQYAWTKQLTKEDEFWIEYWNQELDNGQTLKQFVLSELFAEVNQRIKELLDD
jgi:hypothetical protein